MNSYIATFFTHLSALRTDKTLREKGYESCLAPVPRKLSSSCGTCVMFTAETPLLEMIDDDVETVYLTSPSGDYEKLYENPVK